MQAVPTASDRRPPVEQREGSNEELNALKAQLLDRDFRRMTRLHDLSGQLVGSDEVEAKLGHVIRAALDITAADMGNIQRCDEAGVLAMTAHVGFDPPFLEFFKRVDAGTHSACGAALADRQRVLVDDVTTSPFFAGRPSLAVLTAAGVRAVQSTPLFDRRGQPLGVFSTLYRHVHHFEGAELRWLDLLARHAANVLEGQRADELLALAHRELEARVADRTRWLSLMHEVARAINEAATWDDALHQVLRRLCQTEDWQIGFVYLFQFWRPETIAPVVSFVDDERFRRFHDLSMQQTYSRGDRLPGRVYAGNTSIWAGEVETLMATLTVRADAAAEAGLEAGVAWPIAVRGEVVAVLEIFSTRAHPPSEPLAALMQNVCDQISRVLERERATARMADLVWREQQDLLHTLHDSLGQKLTGLGMLSTGLRRRLEAADPTAAETAEEIARQTQQALDQVRQLANSLFPVEVDAGSLMAALRELAAATTSLHKVDVHVEGESPTSLRDGKIATELYRIVQEAVTNSVKHGHAKTITIRLESVTGLVRLRIADDGVGIQQPMEHDGAGLRIMRFRAASIGASLSVERGTAGGTVVTCSLQELPIRDREAREP